MPSLTESKRLFICLVILGFGLRLGYGVVRYGSSLERLQGPAFVNHWEHDALYHVLIAEALLSGKGYVVDDSLLNPARHVLFAGQEALFKAPLYEFFLAGTFAISGSSFKLFFPLQALLGGFVAAFTGLIGLKVFRLMTVGWFAGVAAAVHPILVNSASQPYNENLFFFFFVIAIFVFLLWFDTPRPRWAILCGLTIGLCMLTRENGLLLLLAMGAVVLRYFPKSLRIWMGYGIIVLSTVAVVAPWTARTYSRFGVFVPVASIVGADLSEGNNECIASESIWIPFWGEGGCPPADEQKRALLNSAEPNPRMPPAVRRDRAARSVALDFIYARPFTYAKLALRRLWTTLLPYNPRGPQRFHEKLVLTLYWALIFPPGLIGIGVACRHFTPGQLLLSVLAALNLSAISAVLYWSDLRFRVGIDLVLACFAGWVYSRLVEKSNKYRKVLSNQ